MSRKLKLNVFNPIHSAQHSLGNLLVSQFGADLPLICRRFAADLPPICRKNLIVIVR
jgi:hypothetical protein